MKSGYREALAGLVALPDLMNCSLADFGRRLAVAIRREQEKPLPDNALIALLCDAARLGDELSNNSVARQKEELSNRADFLARQVHDLVQLVEKIRRAEPDAYRRALGRGFEPAAEATEPEGRGVGALLPPREEPG